MTKPLPPEPQHLLGFYLPESQWRRLRVVAAENGKSVSAFVRKLIEAAIV